MPNTNLATGEINTYFAKVDQKVRQRTGAPCSPSHSYGKLTPPSLHCSQDGSMILEHYDSNEFALLGNFLASEGKQGKVGHATSVLCNCRPLGLLTCPYHHQVLRVEASARKGDGNLVTTIRKALGAKYGDLVCWSAWDDGRRQQAPRT